MLNPNQRVYTIYQMSTLYEALFWEQWDIKIGMFFPLGSLWSIWEYIITEKTEMGSSKDQYLQKELRMSIEFYSQVLFTIPGMR